METGSRAAVRGGYTFGGGTELEKSCPEGVQIDNENYRADLLAQEYAFLTNDRLNGEAGLRYTHCFQWRDGGRRRASPASSS